MECLPTCTKESPHGLSGHGTDGKRVPYITRPLLGWLKLFASWNKVPGFGGLLDFLPLLLQAVDLSLLETSQTTQVKVMSPLVIKFMNTLDLSSQCCCC